MVGICGKVELSGNTGILPPLVECGRMSVSVGVFTGVLVGESMGEYWRAKSRVKSRVKLWANTGERAFF